MTGQRRDMGQRCDTRRDTGQLGDIDVTLVTLTFANGPRFMGVCQGCGKRSDAFTTAGMVWGWEDGHRREGCGGNDG